MTKEEAEAASPLMAEAREMLRKWEAGDKEVRALWEMMNNWVYAGFDETYKMMGVDFDKIYYESQTYLEGKGKVLEGLDKGIFYRREDGSVWADLTKDGLDEKLLLRADGTSVYMTQDIGTAKLRFDDYPINKMIYVVGNEQNYHFQVLKLILKKLGYDEWSDHIYHLSYGMVELPEGKMKSRENGRRCRRSDRRHGIDRPRDVGRIGQTGRLHRAGSRRHRIDGRVRSPQVFHPEGRSQEDDAVRPRESIDFNGNTGPFIQYTHARIRSVLRKAEEAGIDFRTQDEAAALLPEEIELIKR